MFKKKREGTKGSALVLFPDQLYRLADLPDIDRVYILEDPLYFGNDKTYPYSPHGAKLLHMRASMQSYVDQVLWPAKIEVDYLENHDDLWSGGGITKAALDGFQVVYVFEPNDHRLKSRLIKAASDLTEEYQVEWLNQPDFYLKPGEAIEFFERKKTDFASFYQWQRERFNILLGKNYKPVGGSWCIDHPTNNQKPDPVGVQSFGDNAYVKEAYKYVEQRFTHYHDLPEHFIWPINHHEAEAWLEDFLASRLPGYASMSQVIDIDSAWGNRSLLSPLLNSGLLYGQQVIEALLKMHAKKPAELADVELVVRHVVGWREYLRGFYMSHGLGIDDSNYFEAHRTLTASWTNGSTGLAPIDKIIDKTRQNAYISSQERSMVACLMLLVGVNPKNVYAWFKEMTIDAQEWSLVVNTYVISQHSMSGSPITPSVPFYDSNYLIAHGVAEDQGWQEVWDGLYHRFIDMHRHKLDKDIVKAHDKLNEDVKRVLGYRAGDFLASHTIRHD